MAAREAEPQRAAAMAMVAERPKPSIKTAAEPAPAYWRAAKAQNWTVKSVEGKRTEDLSIMMTGAAIMAAETPRKNIWAETAAPKGLRG